MKKITAVAAVSLMAALVAGCGQPTDPAPQTPADQVSERAEQLQEFLHEKDFSLDPQKFAKLHHTLALDLEAPDSADAGEQDTSTEKGVDVIPYVIDEDEEINFCMKDDDGEAHFMIWRDSDGNEIFQVTADQDCQPYLIKKGNYMLEVHHGGTGDHDTLFVHAMEAQTPAADKASCLDLIPAAHAAYRQGPTNSTQLRTIMIETNSCTTCYLVRAQLSGANLQNADLSQANLQEANLRKANLQGANLTGASMANCTLAQANLMDAILNSVNMYQADASQATFDGAQMKNMVTDQANYSDASLRNTDMTNTTATYLTAPGANFSSSNLKGVNFTRGQLQGDNFSDTNLWSTRFANADLTGATFLGAQTNNAIWDNAIMENVTWVNGQQCAPGSQGMCNLN